METNRIPIVFICDENYALPTAVAMTSLKLSKHKTTQYDVFVIGMGVGEDSKNRILSLNDEGFSVSILEKRMREKQAKIAQVRARVTHAALLKFDLPDLFPELDKLLYLDSDMLIQKDLTELYQTDLGEAYAGVVNDAITVWDKEHLEFLQFKERLYFNSGMLLLNLKKMREDSLPEKLLDYRLNGKNFYMDQDTLNVVFAGNIRLVSPEYNLLNCFFTWHGIEEMETFYETEFPRCEEFIYQNAAILHFGDEKKPWRHYMGYLSTLYTAVYNRSPYADKPLVLDGDPLVESEAVRAEQERRIAEQEQRIAELDRQIAGHIKFIEETQRSASFRIGRFFTWIPRKLRGGVRCLRENGFSYTLHRAFAHLTRRA